MTIAARSPLPGEEPASPPATVPEQSPRRRRAPKPPAAPPEVSEETVRPSRGSKPPLPGSEAAEEPVQSSRASKPSAPDSDPDESRKVTLRLPATVADQIAKLAEDRGVPRSQLAREIMERGLHMDGSRFVLPGGEGRAVLEHVGAPPDASTEIPDGYVGDSPDAGGAEAAPSGEAATAARPAAPESPQQEEDEPDPEPVPLAASVSPLVAASALVGLPRACRTAGVFLGLALLVGLLGLAVALLAPRYGLHAPAPGPYASGAYLVDRWTGRVWFCDSAARGLPARGCAPFLRGSALLGQPPR